VCNLIARFASVVMLAWAATAMAQNPAPSAVCRLLAPGGDLIPMEPGGSPSSFPIALCGSSYGGSTWTSITVYLWREQRLGEGWMQNRLERFEPKAQESSGFGERTLLTTQRPGGQISHSLFFRRGCYTVEGHWNAATEVLIRGHLATVDRALAAEPPCPGAQVTPRPKPPAGSMSLGLACDAARLQDAGRVACNAAVSNVPAGAEIGYRWTVDGTVRPGATGRDLLLEGLAVGTHVVSVAARETKSGTELAPQTASLTRRTAGGSSGPTPSGGSGIDLIPIVAGSAIAITLALAGLAWRNRRRAAAPNTASRVQHAPKPAAAPWPRPRPGGGPESVTDEGRRRTPPEVTARLIVQPSIFSERLHNRHTPSIVGDGVDFCFAGFEVTVGPPGQWQLKDAQPTWTATNGSATLVDLYPGFQIQINGRNLAERTHQHNVVVKPDRWHDRDGEIRLALKLLVRVSSVDGETAEVPLSALEERIPIIGANPHTELWIGKIGTDSDDSEATAAGTVTADANGTDRVYVDPAVHLFDLPFAGGLELRLAEALDRSDRVGPEFGIPGNTVDGTEEREQQRVILRCKFRLGEPAAEDTLQIGATVLLQGNAFGLDSRTDPFDRMIADHYAACGKRYAAGGLPEPAPVSVLLRKSVIILEPLANLPHESVDGTSSDEYVARVRARVQSTSGQPVTIAAVQSDRPTVDGWRMNLEYESPVEEPLRSLDAMCARRGGLHAEVRGIDGEGYLVFAGAGGGTPTSYFEYDHWHTFYDAKVRHLAGSGCTMNVTVQADGQEYSGEFFVGPPSATGGPGKLGLIAGAVLLGSPPAPVTYPPPLSRNPLPHDLNHPQNHAPTISGKDFVNWLKDIETLNPDMSRGQIIAAIHARSHQAIDLNRELPLTDIRLFRNGPESDGWQSVKFPTRNNPAFVIDAQGQKIDISHTIAGLRADLNRPESVIAFPTAQFIRWANTDGGDSWQEAMKETLDQGDYAPPDQRAGNALGIKASDFYRDPTTRKIPLSTFFQAEFP